VGLWLWLAFSSGGYIARHWLVPSLTLGFFGLVVSLLVAYPRRPGRWSLALGALLGCYGLWVALSALWADSTTRVWMESGRTFSYLLLFVLALVYFTDASARRALRYLLMAGALFVFAVCAWRLWSTDSFATVFVENRFCYPISYPNGAAALFLVPFWPLMWLAAGPEERAPVRGAAIALATAMFGMAIMTQSRGAMWSLALSLVLVFIVSPTRMRTLVYLLVPALLMLYEFPLLNRYWQEGPETVGGAAGARTLIVGALVAGFLGMILALLERWIRVAGRTKLILNTVVTLATIAGVAYGLVTLTSDAGGPVKWASRAWQQFSGQAARPSESSSTSRFVLISDSGRVDIWRVAWQGFLGHPVVGVGADNFVFQYDRLRTDENRDVQQAHSFELQVLGETGAVGGALVFGGILLGLGVFLWPRCAAGWKGARDTWMRRRRQTDMSRSAAGLAGPSNPRWGSDPRAYGWDMALLAGAAYWLIHAGVDWLWQMPGVTIPALLFVAAGVAAVDAQAGLLRPRINRSLKMGGPAVPAEPVGKEPVDAQKPGMVVQSALAGKAAPADGLLTVTRTSDRRATKTGRRDRQAARKERAAARMEPPGLLSQVFRACLMTLSLVVMLVTGLPYLSLQCQDSAKALAATDRVRAVDRAGAAHWFQPADPDPYVTQAGIYSGAAWAAAESDAVDRAGAVFDNLALGIERYEAAISLEPADWTLYYRAGVMALNLLLAREYAAGLGPELDYGTLIPLIPGLQNWSALADSGASSPEPGIAIGSLVVDARTEDTAKRYRELSEQELMEMARSFLSAARGRNPLVGRVGEAIRVLEQVSGV